MFGTGVYIGASIAVVVFLIGYVIALLEVKLERIKLRNKRAFKNNYISRECAMSYFNNATEDKDISLACVLLYTLDLQEAYKKDQQTAENC